MSAFPSHARVVIVGAGIVGNGLAWHLARLGWRDIVQVDKGPLPNPGGSTGHASSFTFAVDHSRQTTTWSIDSIREFEEMGTFTRTGGIEIARTEERMHELHRRVSLARSYGINARLLTPAEVREMVPYMDETKILGGFYTHDVGVVDPLHAGTIYREKAQALGALQSFANTEVTGLTKVNGRITGVDTTRGHIAADIVVVCGGVWSRQVAEMAGAVIPLVPAVHQMVDIGPVPEFEVLDNPLEYPVVRDMDAKMYARQSGADLEIGSYAHESLPVQPEDIPSNEQALMSPTELPFTSEHFDPYVETVLELYPTIVGNEKVGIKHAINGLMSFVPDGMSLVGETPEVKGLWCCSAIWIKEAPSICRMLAEWMTDGKPEMDPASVNIARFYDTQKTKYHVESRVSELFPKFYGIVHPFEQWDTDRNVRLGAAHAGHKALGGVFVEISGWERPNWYESNAPLLEEFGDRVLDRTHEWDRRWWSPIINAEHLAMRERVGLVENPAFAEWDVSGPGALAWLQHMLAGQVDVPVGKLVYTQMLNEAGGIKADVTVMRLSDDLFRVVDAGFAGHSDLKWMTDHLPPDGSVNFADATTAWTMIAVWGPRARDVVASVTRDDVSNEALAFGSVASIDLQSVRVIAARISYVGELGWELHVPFEQGQRVWDMLLEAGKPFGIAPVGLAAYGGTLRVEKSMRLMGNELELDRNLVEAGLARPRVKAQDFIGKAAYLAQREAGPANLLCTLTVDDNTSASGEKRWMLGHEPICRRDGTVLADRNGRRSFVTTAATGPSVGRHLLMAYLPVEEAVMGNELAVEYIGELYPCSVAAVGAVGVFDPENARMRG
jgi:glycine cleavage system aminomethyltransferase T/glycine/D-amino acid oxidase-like deaminating enzyme